MTNNFRKLVAANPEYDLYFLNPAAAAAKSHQLCPPLWLGVGHGMGPPSLWSALGPFWWLPHGLWVCVMGRKRESSLILKAFLAAALFPW